MQKEKNQVEKLWGAIKDEVKISSIDEDQINDRPQGRKGKDYCQAVSDELYRSAAEIGYGYIETERHLETGKIQRYKLRD